MLERMDAASAVFYSMARSTDCHPFLEFTGLMNEYINLCRAALDRGVDFTCTSIHGTGAQVLPMQPYHREYLSEKLECIYGHSLADLLRAP